MVKTLRGDISKEEITLLHKDCSNPRVKEKLLAIKMLYSGYKATEVAKIIGVAHRTIYNWVDIWNFAGIEGLKDKYNERGRKKYISDREWLQIIEEIEGKGYTLRDIRAYIEETRGISYTYDGVWRILRKQFKVRYGKPYILKANQSETAPKE
ncbi:MAG: helix-turn-helix domain-containing protein [Prochloraceae cyanobacterium]|nr:helix-turn-helix domain-containing protein [Prochloraceae cyanobacterium]